jgi:hypothetical protein
MPPETLESLYTKKAKLAVEKFFKTGKSQCFDCPPSCRTESYEMDLEKISKIFNIPLELLEVDFSSRVLIKGEAETSDKEVPRNWS